MRLKLLATASLFLLGGCVPDLGQWQLVSSGVDGSVPSYDGGGPGPNPIDRGTPCPNPYLLMGTVTGTSDTAQVIRVDPATGSRCRQTPQVAQQLAFGSAIPDVDWHPSTGEVLGLSDAVIALDDQGFEGWRYQPFGELTGFSGGWVVGFSSSSGPRIAVAWNESSSSLDSMLLLSADGQVTAPMITPPFFGAMIAVHPDGSGRLLMPSKANANIDVYTVNDSTTSIRPDTDATPLWPGMPPSLYDTYGQRTHVGTDLMTQRIAITHQTGVAVWQVGAPAPSSAMTCPSYCDSFQASAPDPNANGGAYSICKQPGGSARHLVRLHDGTCDLVIDGTSLGHQTLQDIALVRAAL